MLTNEERIRAMLGNLKNWPWDLYPVFKIEKEDAAALFELLTQKGWGNELFK